MNFLKAILVLTFLAIYCPISFLLNHLPNTHYRTLLFFADRHEKRGNHAIAAMHRNAASKIRFNILYL